MKKYQNSIMSAIWLIIALAFCAMLGGVQGKRKNCAKHNPRHCVDRTGCSECER